MRLHLASTRLPLHLALALIFGAFAVALRGVPVPVGARFEFSVPAGILLPVIGGVVLVAGTISPVPGAVFRGLPRVRVSDAIIGGVAIIACATVIVLIGASGHVDPAYAAAVVRNYLISLALGTGGVLALGAYGFWLPPIVCTLVSMVAGRAPDGSVRAWAVLARSTAGPDDLSLAVACVLGALAIRAAVESSGLPRGRD